MRLEPEVKDENWYHCYVAMYMSIEWMCDYCCEEEEKRCEHQKCKICKVVSGTSEILKVVRSSSYNNHNN